MLNYVKKNKAFSQNKTGNNRISLKLPNKNVINTDSIKQSEYEPVLLCRKKEDILAKWLLDEKECFVYHQKFALVTNKGI